MLDWFVFASILRYAVPATFGIIFVAILLGLFESRANGDYRLHGKKLLLLMAGLVFCGFLSASFILPYLLKLYISDAVVTGETSVLRNRAATEYASRNLQEMFPDVWPSSKADCYRAAVSNYIEDHWETIRREEACKEWPEECSVANNDSALFAALRTRAAAECQAGKDTCSMGEPDFFAIGVLIGQVWVVASEMYKLERRQFGIPTDGKPAEPFENSMRENYQNYIATCSSLMPKSWVSLNQALVTTYPQFCWGKCL